jgi:Uma2 family endonuclease
MTTIPHRVTETTPADHVPGQGQWTYEHYAALDDGERYEIIDGVLYMTPAPNWWHQQTLLEIAIYLRNFVETAGLGEIAIAPLDVELAPNTVVQPDIIVILNEHRERITYSRVIGAPDLAVEVISPGTRTHDRRRKFAVYVRYGIPEYWLVNPETRTIEIYALEEGAYQPPGVFRGQGTLRSRIVPQMETVCAEQCFA